MKKFTLLPPLLALAVLCAAPAYAQKQTPLVSGIALGADLQLARQGTYPNGDTGSGTYACAWEWLIGSGLAYENTQAPSARGLAAAYRATGDADYLLAAECAALQIIARNDAPPFNRPFSDEVVFLVDLSGITRNPVYASKAGVYHERTRTFYGSGAALADRYVNLRRSLAGWDLASQIQAALAVGQKDFARDIALRLIERRAEWEGVAYYDGWDYTQLSLGALVGALRDVHGQTVKSYWEETVAAILQAQVSDGSWQGDYQVTAFALMGLAAAPPATDVQQALLKGLHYLLATQTVEGGWSYPGYGEYGEVNGEVLSALASLVHRAGADKK